MEKVEYENFFELVLDLYKIKNIKYFIFIKEFFLMEVGMYINILMDFFINVIR